MTDDFFDQFLRFSMLFGSNNVADIGAVRELADDALEKTTAQVRIIKSSPGPSPRISWHFCLYLYHLGRIFYKDNRIDPAIPYLVNKLCNGIDLYYEINLGESFAVAHTTGCVFAKANYSSYFVFHQNVTVGRFLESRPTLESDVIMFPGSMVIGNCLIRRNTVISAGTRVIGKSTPGDCIVFERKSGNLQFKPLDHTWTDSLFYKS